jgi:predicted Zn-dependent protease
VKRTLLTLCLSGLLLALAAPDGNAQRRHRGPLRGGIPVENDVQIGMETVNQINADPATYPVLDESEYPEAYELIQGIVNRVLASPAIEHKDTFKYQDVKIIHDDKTLNAFCTAGGFIYVYTGLIKYLDREDHLAGVLGHEIAHAEERHVADQLEKKGRRRLLKLAAILAVDSGSGEVAAVLAGTKLLGLKYGRTQEAEADARSVVYLADAEDYACNGAAGFFEKLEEEGDGGQPPHWLSDHPDGAARIREINQQASELRCSTELGKAENYARLQVALP